MSTALSPVDAAGAAGASLEQAEPEPLANEAELLGLHEEYALLMQALFPSRTRN